MLQSGHESVLQNDLFDLEVKHGHDLLQTDGQSNYYGVPAT